MYLRDGAAALTITLDQNVNQLPGHWTSDDNDGVSAPWPMLNSSQAGPYTVVSNSNLETSALSYIPFYASSIRDTEPGVANVAPGRMTGSMLISGGTEGIPVTAPIAQFTYAGTAADLSHLHAQIDWGDGRDPQSLSITATGGGFLVTGQMLYLMAGTYSATLQITDDRTGNSTVGMIQKSLAISSHLSMHVGIISPTSGQEFSGYIGFIDSQGSSLWSSAMTVSINWGDGTSSDGSVVDTGNGVFGIQGAHTYSAVPYGRNTSLVVSVHETRTSWTLLFQRSARDYSIAGYSNAIAIAAAPVTEFEVYQLADTARSPNAGKPTGIILGGITLPPDESPSDIAGTVTWDDGQTTPVLVTPVSLLNPFNYSENPTWGWPYALTTTTDFATAGTHHGVLTLSSATKTESYDVSEQVSDPHTDIGGAPAPAVSIGTLIGGLVAAIKNESWTGEVARFRPNPQVPFDPASATVTIDWGDSSSSTGTLVLNADGWYSVIASHTYDRNPAGSAGLLYVTANIATSAGFCQTLVTAGVALDPSRIDLNPVSTIDYREHETFTALLGKFTAPAGTNPPPDAFTATIYWGDGSSSAGTIYHDTDGAYEISSTHTYAIYGPVAYAITVTGPGGPASMNGSLSIAYNPVEITPESDVSMDDNGTVSGTFAHFTDSDPIPYNSAVSYVALIDWGDGQTSDGKIVGNANGGYDVTASHSYASDGDFAVSMIVRRNVRDLPGLATQSFYDFASRDVSFPVAYSNEVTLAGFSNSFNAVYRAASTLGISTTFTSASNDTDSHGIWGTFHIRGSNFIQTMPVSTTDPTTGGNRPGLPDLAGEFSNVDNSRLFNQPVARELDIESVALSASRAAGASGDGTPSTGSATASVAPPTNDWVSPELPEQLPAPDESLPVAPDDPGTFAGEFFLARYAEQAPQAPAVVPEGGIHDDQLSRGKDAAPRVATVSTAMVATQGSGESAKFLVVPPPPASSRDGQQAQTDAGMLLPRQWWSAQLLASSAVALHFHRAPPAARRTVADRGRALIAKAWDVAVAITARSLKPWQARESPARDQVPTP